MLHPIPGAEAKLTSPPKNAAQPRGSYHCLVEYDSRLFSIRWSGSPDTPGLADFPFLGPGIDIVPVPLAADLALLWRSSTLHDYGSHGSIRSLDDDDDDGTFPILKLAHPDDALSLRLIEREFRILLDLRTLGVPVVDFDPSPIVTRDGVLHGYRMKELARLEPGELHARYEDVREAFRSLHRAGYCHGDFHPSNVMRAADGRLVIIDFGFAGRIGSPVPSFIPSWRFPTGRYSPDQDIAALDKYVLSS